MLLYVLYDNFNTLPIDKNLPEKDKYELQSTISEWLATIKDSPWIIVKTKQKISRNLLVIQRIQRCMFANEYIYCEIFINASTIITKNYLLRLIIFFLCVGSKYIIVKRAQSILYIYIYIKYKHIYLFHCFTGMLSPCMSDKDLLCNDLFW
jgi:hypothetical protein